MTKITFQIEPSLNEKDVSKNNIKKLLFKKEDEFEEVILIF